MFVMVYIIIYPNKSLLVFPKADIDDIYKGNASKFLHIYHYNFLYLGVTLPLLSHCCTICMIEKLAGHKYTDQLTRKTFEQLNSGLFLEKYLF